MTTPYATAQDFVDDFADQAVEVSNPGNPGATDPDLVRIQKAIDSACNQIDGCVSGRFPELLQEWQVDPTKIPSVLARSALDLAYVSLARSIPEDSTILLRWKEAIKQLDRIAKGDPSVLGLTIGLDLVVDRANPVFDSDPGVFTEEVLNAYF